jgi:hypothetical protein
MTIPINPQAPFSPFLPTTYNFPQEADRAQTFVQDQFAQHSDVINDKKIGVYVEETSTLNGNKHWYATTEVTRNGYQSFVFIRSLPNTGTLVLTAGTNPAFPIDDVQPEFLMWHVWGTASKPPSAFNQGDGDFFSFMAQGDTRISFTMSDTTLTITTTVDLSAYFGFIVAEFIRAGTNGI